MRRKETAASFFVAIPGDLQETHRPADGSALAGEFYLSPSISQADRCAVHREIGARQCRGGVGPELRAQRERLRKRHVHPEVYANRKPCVVLLELGVDVPLTQT